MAFIEYHYHYSGLGQVQTQAIHLKLDQIMANAAELLAKVEVIKTNVSALDANIKNIDADVKGLIELLGDGATLDEVAIELEKLSVKTGELTLASKTIADSVPDPQPPVDPEVPVGG